MNLDLLYLIGSWTVIVLFHEIGHGIGFYIACKKFFKIHFKWWGLCVGSKEEHKELNMNQKYLGTYSGVLLGLIPLYFFYGDKLPEFMFYILVSSMDLLSIWFILLMKPEMTYSQNKSD